MTIKTTRETQPESGAAHALASLVDSFGVELVARGLLTWEDNVRDMLGGATEIRLARARDIRELSRRLRPSP